MSIDNFRKEIDQIDNQIIELLNKRVNFAQKIGEIKKEKKLPIYVPERERAIYDKIASVNQGPMPTSAIQNIFREIISCSRDLERPLRISYLGPAGTYTHQASLYHFGSATEQINCGSIRDVFVEVEKYKADYGIVPIENSYNGVVFQTLDAFLDFDLKIIAEIYLRIRHSLLSNEKDLSRIKKIYSHPQSFEQCRVFLNSQLSHAQKIEVVSNSQAALMASGESGAAAIASHINADLYNLKIAAGDIEDAPDNYTRFVVLGKESPGKALHNKTSLIFSIVDRPGVFSSRAINLTKIESRPSKRKAWDYVFFIDMEGHREEQKIQEAIENIKDFSLFHKILGSYARGEIV